MCTKEKLQTVMHEVVDAALALTPKVQKIILYGSYARGDNNEDSDIDLMILMDGTEKEISKYRIPMSQAMSRISLKNDVLIAAVVRDKNDYLERQNYIPYYKNVAREGIELYGRTA